jgi:DNA-binding response OmpR family regulator
VAVVLIVDDDEDIGDALALALTDEGHKGIAARTADDALALASSEVPELILVDYNMPGVDTRRLIADLRGIDPNVRVMVCTGESLGEERVRELGADGTLRKPFSIDVLLRLLQADDRPVA